MLELGKGLIRPDNPATLERKTKEGDPVCGRHRTLLLIDFELELYLQESTDTSHDTPSRPRTPDQDDKVIGVPGKSEPSTLKFLVQVIEKNIGQKRRQRATLCKASYYAKKNV